MYHQSEKRDAMIPVISFVGRSNCGKTTYLEKLIAEMKRRGWRIATVKHDVHGFEMDRPGKDTWRHSQAGADTVCISSPWKMAMIRKVEREMSLDEVVGMIRDVDIVFTEGYKREARVKVEVFRREACDSPLCASEELLAVVTDTQLFEKVPHFSVEDAASFADFLERGVLANR